MASLAKVVFTRNISNCISIATKSCRYTFATRGLGCTSNRFKMSEIFDPPKSLLQPLICPRKLLMGPGPSNCSPRVLAAGSLPQLGHMHQEMFKIMDDIKAGIQYAFQTKNELTLAISGSGHAGMETACCNLVERGDVVMVAVNGLWGERFSDMVDRCGGKPEILRNPLGIAFSLEQIEEGLKEHKPSVFFVTHGESSSGVCQPLEGVGALCHKYNCILLVDSVAALGGVPMYMDKWEIDVLYTGAQKVISAPSGTSPISFNERARAKINNRKQRVQSFYFDLQHLANYWGVEDEPRRYHHTCPTPAFYMLREGLARLAEEGLEASWEKHRKCAEQLHAGLAELGLELFVPDPAHRLLCVTTIKIPEGLDWNKITKYAMDKYLVEITGGLGPSIGLVGRIGTLGYNATPENVSFVLRIVKEAMAAYPKSKY